jgi:hypothetical protein
MGKPSLGAPKQEPVEPLGIGVMGEEAATVLHGGAEQERLAAGTGTQVEHGLPGAGLDEEAEELTALILDLEETLAEGVEPIEVGPGADDVEGERTELPGPGLHALGEQAGPQLLTGGAERIHAKRNGTGDIEVGTEVLGCGAELAGEVVGEPVGKGEAEGEGRGRLGDEGGRNLQACEPSGLINWDTGEAMEEGEEQRGRGGLGVAEEEAEPAPPEADVEDEFGEGLALLAGEGAVGAEGAVEHALGGVAGEDGVEGLGGDGGESLEGRPGERAKTGERVKTGC